MDIIIEMDEKDPAIILNDCNQFTIVIDGCERYFQVRDWERSTGQRDYTWSERPSVFTRFRSEEITQLTIKTKEEIAAEESVAKAKEALKAAENALKVVKEQKV